MDRIESVITIGHAVPGIDVEPVRWHWVLTAEAVGGERWTYDGLVDVLPSATRSEVYGEVLAGIGRAYGGGRLTVIEWALAPESLGGAQ
ncbi:hypothetical protein [Streptomyces lavendulae]|uniref:hypothetical protein n=1 Tax=Streptomyces lavendulae TaxID=1914 RepID=UPI0024A35874|nr:hypothetical protein [Streptomyces lavendulae]GLW04771.1 hypothetical protein Slala05_84010 [Streptomyces lavendulae subsp. lavendulae]